jgi:DNA-directed RNA polymerase specialized sigma24 family protein
MGGAVYSEQTSNRNSHTRHFAAKKTALLTWLADWRRKVSRRARFLQRASVEFRALLAAASAIEDQICRDEVGVATTVEFQDHCEPVLRIHIALIDLARICKKGSESKRPSGKPWLNADAWQNTYVTLADRISDGRVDIGRPLEPLAQITARRFFLTDCRRLARFSALTETQLHRFNLGEEALPEEQVEAARSGEMLHAGVARLRAEGRLSDAEVEILTRRYVGGWSSGEVATAAGLAAENVRQVCSRRCGLLRATLAGQGLEEAIA